jgi:hypothetical protein
MGGSKTNKAIPSGSSSDSKDSSKLKAEPKIANASSGGNDALGLN